MKRLSILLAISSLALLISSVPGHAVPIGYYPGLETLIKQADAIVILRIDRHLTGFGSPTFYSTHECYIYQTLKGDIKNNSRINLQLMNTEASFVTPYAWGSTHLMFLMKKATDDEPTEYRTITFKGAQILLSPLGHEKPPKGRTIEEKIKNLIKDTIAYWAKEHEKNQKFLETMLGKQTEKVTGRVIDEEGKPLAGVQWRISGIEELHEGNWIVVQKSGWPQEHVTGADGCFVVTFQENVRYDLQFDKWGYGPVFLYQISASSPEINVVMKKGVPIRGSVTRLVDGIRKPVSGAPMIELRLPNPRGFCYSKKVYMDHQGKFEFFASVPPQPPPRSLFTSKGEVCYPRLQPDKWQVVFAGEIVEIDVEEGKQVDEIHFEIQVKVTR